MRIPSFITPNWLTVTRILFIPVGVYFVIRDGVIPASKGGKLKTFFQGFGVGFFVLPLPASLDWFKFAFISVAIILTLTSAYEYINAWRTSAGKGKVK